MIIFNLMAIIVPIVAVAGITYGFVIMFSPRARAKKETITTTVRAVKEGNVGDDTIYCKHCGESIDEDSKFCKKCGKEQ